MRLPVNPCETTLTFKLYDQPYKPVLIYDLSNEIILYGSTVTYNTWYSVNADNWHEVSCTATQGNDCRKINTCFQGWFTSCWRSSVCTKITPDSGIYHGYIDNKIWYYAANINQCELYNNKIVLDGEITADTNDCYREYIWEV